MFRKTKSFLHIGKTPRGEQAIHFLVLFCLLTCIKWTWGFISFSYDRQPYLLTAIRRSTRTIRCQRPGFTIECVHVTAKYTSDRLQHYMSGYHFPTTVLCFKILSVRTRHPTCQYSLAFHVCAFSDCTIILLKWV